MTFYNLNIVEDGRTLEEVARDREHALVLFGKRLGGVKLTLKDNGSVAPYFMAESEDEMHWVNPTIPVYVERNRS
jgi:hypothetical protein